MREIRYAEAINEALMEEMTRDETVYVIGQCASSDPLGHLRGLYDKFGKERVKDAPLTETAIMGSSVGAALGGYRPVANFRFCDFIVPAFDELLHKAAKWRFAHGGQHTVPLVVLAGIGGYIGAGPEHSQSLEAAVMHTPGLKLVIPTTPYEAKGLLKTAIRDNNPVVYYFHKLFLGSKGEVPEEEYTIPFGIADIKREGTDVTVVATGYMVPMALHVANQLQKKGISLEVIDPRTLEPFDIETIVDSVKKTNHAVIVDEDTLRCGVTGEIAMQIMERGFDYLDAPIHRVAAANLPVPGGVYDQYVLPSVQGIADAVRESLQMDEPLTVQPMTSARLDSAKHAGDKIMAGRQSETN